MGGFFFEHRREFTECRYYDLWIIQSSFKALMRMISILFMLPSPILVIPFWNFSFPEPYIKISLYWLNAGTNVRLSINGFFIHLLLHKVNPKFIDLVSNISILFLQVSLEFLMQWQPYVGWAIVIWSPNMGWTIHFPNDSHLPDEMVLLVGGCRSSL